MARITEADGTVRLGNALVELGFSASDGALNSIIDKASGCEMRRDAAAPGALYRLALRRAADREIEWLESRDAGSFEWRADEDDGTAVLTLVSSGFAGREVRVTVTVTLNADSALSAWRMRVDGVGDATVYQLTCPIVSGLFVVGDPAPGEAIAFPRQSEGYLYRNPFPVRDRLPLRAGAGPETADIGIGELHGLYPGNIPVQFCACYHDEAGLYLATHDAGQNVKTFGLTPVDGSPVLSVSHLPSEVAGADAAFDYDTMVGTFHGDWYDAAEIYRSWATRQWWCETKLIDRDIAPWMRSGFGVFQMSNYHLPVLKMNHPLATIADTVNELSADAGVPLLGLIFNWERGGGWTGPKGFFPPREGENEFRNAMRRLREAGNYGFVYITGGQWYIRIGWYPYDSWAEFEAEGRANAIMNAHGVVDIGRWYETWEGARICPATPYVQQLQASIVMHLLDLGCPVIQIDNFPCVGSEACHDPSHGHPLGHGRWWSEAWGRMLADIRREARAKDPGCALATEGVSENFIPWLDLFDQRAGNMEFFGHYRRGDPMGGETIPLFSYVYNEYIGAYTAAYPECNRPEVLYWTRCFGKALTQSVVPTGGRYFPEPAEFNPITLGFYKKVARAAAQECWPYLMFGEMLRPPAIDVPSITAQYCNFTDDCDHPDPLKRHEVADRAVQHAAWRGPDGSIGIVFVNISEEAVAFDVELPAYGMDGEAFDVDRITDGERERWLSSVALPRTEGIDMAPLSVVLVHVTKNE